MKIDTSRFIRSAVSEADLVEDGLPHVAFAGRSNVGKSSLLNRLLGRKSLARISSTPGRTQAINYFLINSGFYFVDLPGYGYAKVGKQVRREWAKLMDGYFRAAPGALHVVQLVDSKVGATPLDVEAKDYFADLGIATTVVATKIDKVGRGRRAQQLKDIRATLRASEDTALVPFSAVKGDGIKELWSEISTFLREPSSSHQATRGAS